MNQQQMQSCARCGGAILLGNGPWGYGGPLCYCGQTSTQTPQYGASQWPSDHAKIMDRFDRIEALLLKLINSPPMTKEGE